MCSYLIRSNFLAYATLLRLHCHQLQPQMVRVKLNKQIQIAAGSMILLSFTNGAIVFKLFTCL